MGRKVYDHSYTPHPEWPGHCAVCGRLPSRHSAPPGNPFAGIEVGDSVRVVYCKKLMARMLVCRVDRFAIEGLDGEYACWISRKGREELCFYGEAAPHRVKVRRHVSISLAIVNNVVYS